MKKKLINITLIIVVIIIMIMTNIKTNIKDFKEITQKKDRINLSQDKNINSLNTTGSINVTYPSNWQNYPSNGNQMYSLDADGTNVNLEIEDISDYTIEEYKILTKKVISNTFKISGDIESVNKVYNENESYVLKFDITLNETKLTMIQSIFFNNKKAYIFNIVGRPDKVLYHMPDFEKMLNSVSF